ncbi:MAG: hypothetical protein EOO92_01055 [Pedobacter sp.]|nr:MAG: hypothetical protein EOO92_01055 [Pedobacter sp.]
MRSRKVTIQLSAILILFVVGIKSYAQDVVVIAQGNFTRGTIKAADLSTVVLKNENESVVMYKAKDIKEFLWNGETFISKPVVVKKDLEYRFFKVVELGAVNLYSIGGQAQVEEPVQKKAKFRPSIGIGAGGGGFGGVGMGGGVSIGGVRGRENVQAKMPHIPVTFFIEKIGTGPLIEIYAENANQAARLQTVKSILLQKMNNDNELAETIKAAESFDGKSLTNLVTSYNAKHK